MFLAMGEAPLAGVFFSSERPNDSTVGVICCLIEVEASCFCLTSPPGGGGIDPAAAATGAAGVVAAEAAALAALDFFFFWFFERGVEGVSAGVLMPADEGEGLVAGMSISASEKMDVGDGGPIASEVFVDVVAIVVLMKAGESCRGS